MITDPFGIIRTAKRRLPRMMFDFIDGGTGRENAQSANLKAFETINLQARVLKNVNTLSVSTKVLGETYDRPFGIAPMGMCNLIHPMADQALSDLARSKNIPHCVSTAASTEMERSFENSDGNAWFQLYAGSNDSFSFELVDRAAKAGFQHLVFTVDTPRHSRRTRDLENGFSVPLKIGPKQFLDFALHPSWSIRTLVSGTPAPMNFETSHSGSAFVRGDSRGGSDWEFLNRLRDTWKGKLLVKGINSSKDAAKVKSSGCDAVYVSNHGGRQLDSGLPAIESLSSIRKTVGDDFPIVFDSGVRTADDVVRALALGADFVMLGRPLLFALGAGGPKALTVFMDRFEEDLKSVMAQIGTTKIAEITKDVLVKDGVKRDG